MNDEFYFVDQSGSCSLTGFKLQVFNRWGRLVWESNEAGEKWDGTNKSGKCDSGTYFWKLRFSNGFTSSRINESGSVTLLD
jgi:gliding motility-associated-like protein